MIRHALVLLFTMAVASPLAASPVDEAFIARFVGSWSGEGVVMESGMATPRSVTCRLEGRSGQAAFTMAGRCRAAVIVSRAIAASVAYDPASGQFRGTYEGSRAGIAQLAGQRQGDALQLSVVWPRPVHGDPRGRMTIVNEGGGSLRIVVDHPYGPAGADGQPIRSADLVLRRE